MLKLVISNPLPVSQKPSFEGLDRFYGGETLGHRVSGERVLVLGCSTDGMTAMLMPLSDGEPYESRIEDMKDWSSVYLPGPRLVEVRRKSSKKVEWSSYVPDFDAALAVWRQFQQVKPEDFEVEIYVQHTDELLILEDCGYFSSNRALSS